MKGVQSDRGYELPLNGAFPVAVSGHRRLGDRTDDTGRIALTIIIFV
jgi:hypothetical protein